MDGRKKDYTNDIYTETIWLLSLLLLLVNRYNYYCVVYTIDWAALPKCVNGNDKI